MVLEQEEWCTALMTRSDQTHDDNQEQRRKLSQYGDSAGSFSQTTSLPSDPEQMLSVSIITRRKQPLNLEALGGRVLSRLEFDGTYAGDPADFASLRNFARSHGLSIDEDSSSLARLTLVMFGCASAMEKAFGVKLLSYTSSDGLPSVHVPEGTVQVPRRYAQMIKTVLGLDSRTVAKSHG